jgi:hypothetical protein
VKKSVSHVLYINPSFTLIKIDFLTLLFLFFIRLFIHIITVYIEHIQIKLIILLSSLTQLIKSVLDKETKQNRYVSTRCFMYMIKKGGRERERERIKHVCDNQLIFSFRPPASNNQSDFLTNQCLMCLEAHPLHIGNIHATMSLSDYHIP